MERNSHLDQKKWIYVVLCFISKDIFDRKLKRDVEGKVHCNTSHFDSYPLFSLSDFLTRAYLWEFFKPSD